MYVVTNNGVDCSGEGTNYIKTIGGCKNASHELGKTFVGSDTWGDYQTGCIQFDSNNSVYWNVMKGKTNAKGRSICHRTGKALLLFKLWTVTCSIVDNSC